MSAVREGQHLANEGRELTQKMRDGVLTGAPKGDAGVQGGAKAIDLQRDFTAYDSRDDLVRRKMQLMDDDGMTPFGRVYYSDEDGKWLEKKEAAVESANFDKWFNDSFNKNDLASRQLAQQLNPEFYAARERKLRERTEEVLALKNIQLRGPQTEEDLRRLFLINTGRVQLPPDWDRIGSTTQDPKRTMQVFQQGLIRAPLFYTRRQRTTTANQNVALGVTTNPSPENKLFAWGTGNATNTLQNPSSLEARTTLSEVVFDRMRQMQ